MHRSMTLTTWARSLAIVALCATGLQAGTSTDTVVARGSTWSFLDDGSDQGTAWKESAFDDSLWSVGPAHLGYGDSDEATTIDFGGDPANKHITTYFRHAFDVHDPGDWAGLRLRLLRDDGAVVFHNGNVLRFARQLLSDE